MVKKAQDFVDYTDTGGRCVVVTIECIYELEEQNQVETDLETLRGNAAAEVVSRRIVSENFDEAVTILQRRKAQGE